MSNIVLSHMSKWFIVSKLALNLDKMNIKKFIMNNSPNGSRRIVLVKCFSSFMEHAMLLGLCFISATLKF
jgi:hypothetical protein